VRDRDANGTSAADSNTTKCEFQPVAPSFDKVLCCVLLLLAVFIFRVSTVSILRMWKPSLEVPDSLKFPAWEGPVFLVEYLALCDAVMETVSSSCSWWIIFGVSIFLFGPLMIILISMVVLVPYLHKDDVEVFEDSDRPSLREALNGMLKAKGLLGKLTAINFYWNSLDTKGAWDESNETIRFWIFMIGDYTRKGWFFAFWPLLRRIVMSAIVNLTDGNTNALLSLAVQNIDTWSILLMSPYISTQGNLVEGIGGVSNLITYLILTVPRLAQLETPSWLGDKTTMVFALFSTGLASFVSMLDPVCLLLSNIHNFFSNTVIYKWVNSKVKLVKTFSSDSMAKFGNSFRESVTSGLTVASANLSDEIQAQVQERLEHRLMENSSQEDEEDTEQEDDLRGSNAYAVCPSVVTERVRAFERGLAGTAGTAEEAAMERRFQLLQRRIHQLRAEFGAPAVPVVNQHPSEFCASKDAVSGAIPIDARTSSQENAKQHNEVFSSRRVSDGEQIITQREANVISVPQVGQNTNRMILDQAISSELGALTVPVVNQHPRNFGAGKNAAAGAIPIDARSSMRVRINPQDMPQKMIPFASTADLVFCRNDSSTPNDEPGEPGASAPHPFAGTGLSPSYRC
jgi:hypothetical protein